MRWVPAAAVRPHRCACIPFIGSHDPGGFFDFNTEIAAFDGHVYVSVVAARQMAEYMGWQPAGQNAREIEALQGEKVALEARVADLETERDELMGQLAAVDTLRNGAFVNASRGGRPSTKSKAVV